MANLKEATATKQNYQEVIRSDGKYWSVTLAMSVIFVTLGTWASSRSNDIGGYTLLAAGAIVAVMALFHLPGSSFLGITSNGLTVRYRWCTEFLSWSDIESFGVAEFSVKSSSGGHRLRRAVGIKFARDFSRKGHSGTLHFINKLVAGFEAVLPADYGRDCAHLARHLNQLKERYDPKPDDGWW